MGSRLSPAWSFWRWGAPLAAVLFLTGGVEAPAQTAPAQAAPDQTKAVPSTAGVKSIPDLVMAARDAVRRHSDELRIGLHLALKDGGPKAAIGACTSLAPEIDGRVAEQSGFEIGRTALKIRNPENTPDAWERQQLEAFVQKLAAGSDHKTLEVFDIQTTSEGQKLFRYMRPIMMGEGCLACHGPNVAQDVKAEIARTYNDDKAVGFKVDELRGAFTLMQVIE